MSEVVLVGGGVIGCSLAWRLAVRGVRVRLLERASTLGAESTFAAGGILAPQAEAKHDGPLLRLGCESRDRFPSFVEELRRATGIDPAFDQRGLLEVAHSAEEARELQARLPLQAQLGFSAQWLPPAVVAEREPHLAPTHGGLFFSQEAALEPRLLLEALALAGTRAGAQLHTKTTVARVLVEKERVSGLELSNGERISCSRVVLCAGSWSSLVPNSTLPADSIVPIRGQMLSFALPPNTLSRVVYSAKGYLIPRRDGRVLAGSTMERVGFEKAVTGQGLAQIAGLAVELLPGLAGAPLVDSWSGLRPGTSDGLPVIGPTRTEGLWVASGHFRNGILLCPLTADALTDALCGGTWRSDFAPLSPQRFA